MDYYEENLVYNIVANAIWQNTDWYTEAQIDTFWNDFTKNKKNQTTWDFDNELFGKLAAELLQRIDINITYSNKVPELQLDETKEGYGEFVKDEDNNIVYTKDSTKRHWFYINQYMEDGMSYADAVAAVNANEGVAQGFECDPNLRYFFDEDGISNGEILLFAYGDKTLEVQKTDTVTEIAFNALELAWETAIEPTLELLEVDYDRKVDSAVFDEHVSNFDRKFYDWKSKNENGGWNTNDWTANYSAANVEAWAADVYNDFSYKSGVTPSAAAFLEGVAEAYDFDRTIVEDPQNNWRDIDASKLFVELRYSPLADLYFKKQTGPINLYFAETGAPNLKAFFNTAFTEYSSIVEGVNNGIVAAVKDLFPDSSHIGLADENATDGVASLARPALAEIKTTDSHTIATTLVSSAAKMFEYVANATDENILGAFYANNTSADKTNSSNISEANIEEAVLPLLISLLNEINLTDCIHDEDWDTCIDGEGVAVVALREYLSYVLPDKDYSSLWTVNSNNQLFANFDLNHDGKKELFIDAIMPMARDALGYVLQSVVTCRDASGAEWSVYKSVPTEDQTSIFDILNSVLCYYAGTDEFDNSSGSGPSTIQGKGIAALLGCVDGSGKCTVSFNNDIWTNIDIMVDTLLPAIGLLQTGTFGECDSYDLLYTKIVQGVLEISDNGGAITNFLEQLVDIINSAPLNTGADVALYDYIVAPTVNAIFGGKYSGQENFATVIPENAVYYDSDSSSNTKGESPFNALIHVDTLGGYKNTGVLSILISNIVEAFGVNEYKSKSGDRWQGAMFAVKAVNNFIPSFVPQLSDMKFGPVTANIDVSSYSGMASNQTLGTGNYLTIKNTSLGLNRFYRPDGDSKVQREPRYFAEIKEAEIYEVVDGYDDPAGSIYLSGTRTGVVSPGGSLKIPILGTAPFLDGTYIYKVAVTYNMFEGELNGGSLPSANGNYMFSSDITTYSYMTITVGGSWQSVVYPDEMADKDDDDNVTTYYLGLAYSEEPGEIMSYEDDPETDPNSVTNSTAGGQNDDLVASVPTNIVIPSENPSIADMFTVRVVNTNGNNNAKRTYSGAVAFAADGTQYYPVSGTNISSTLETVSDDESYDMGYALIDEDGNLINRDYYDYRIKNTDGTYGEWQRGFTRDQLNDMEISDNGIIKTEFDEGRVEERIHVTYTLQEALNAGIVTGVQRTETSEGVYTYQNVFVNANSTLVGKGSDAITWVTPFDGYYFQNHGAEISGNDETYDTLIKYDGSGVTPSRDGYKMNLCFVTPQGTPMIASTNVYIADQSDLYNLTSAYNNEVSKMASYRPADFLDFNETTQKSANYNAIIDAMTDALNLASTPLSVDAAASVSSTKITKAKAFDTTGTIGDPAYKPATENQIPSSVRANAYKSGDIYYYNKECTVPIYSNVALTDADVTNGKDAAGQAVTKLGSTWYLANAVKYESEWDTTTYDTPYYAPVEDEDHIAKSNGNTVYKQTQYVYRDADGEGVSAEDEWVVKFADTETVVKPNDGNEYRGAYQQGIDTINYWNSIFSKILKPVGAQSVADEVTAVRSVDSHSVNYDVASYEKMVNIAREAERLIWYEDTVDENGKYIYDEDGNRVQTPVTDKSSMEIEVAVNEFKKYFDLAKATERGYIGDKLEAEISDHHAIGGTYAKFTATKDEDDVYTISVAQGTNLGFGSRAADGTLVNEDAEGNKVYTDASWADYVNALGTAVDAVTNQEKVTGVYDAKSHLVIAENNLEPYTGEEGEDNTKFTVTGVITISEDREGTSGKYGVGGISIIDAQGKELAVSEADGSFEIQLPKGEASTLTLTCETSVDRTITISGDTDVENINIPVIVCNYEKSDNFINYKDLGLFVDYMNSSYVFANLEASDSIVNYKDLGLFVDFIDNAPVTYAEWSQN